MCNKNHDHMLYCSCDMVHDGCNCYFSLWAIFCPFTLLNSPKNENFKKMKKPHGDIIILHKCNKNHDHMVYCSWEMACDGCNCYFSFWAIFYPLTLPPPHPNLPKKWKFQKNEKNAWRYHHFTLVYQSYAILFLRYNTWWM